MDIDIYRKRIEIQKTPEIDWSNTDVDHLKPICSFDNSNQEELKLAFNWKNSQPLHKEGPSLKGVKFNFLDYPILFIKIYQFLKLNEEDRLKENVH